MTKDQDAVLKKELGKLGKTGSIMGSGSAGGLAGGMGAAFASQFLPTECVRKEIELDGGAAQLLPRVSELLDRIGRMVDPKELEDTPFPRVAAVVGSGFFRLNPTLVQVEITEEEEGRCTLRIQGAAKEGLIKQRSAQKAVNRVAEALGAPTEE